MPRPFAPPGTAPHYVPDRPVAVNHVRLSFEPDLAARTLQGQSRLSLTARQDGLDEVELNAVAMTIEQVSVDGKPVSEIDYDGERLRIALGRTFARDERFTLAVDYRCTPRRVSTSSGPTRPTLTARWNAGVKVRMTIRAPTGPASTCRSKRPPARCSVPRRRV